jgi:flagellar biosynthesis protein FlhB
MSVVARIVVHNITLKSNSGLGARVSYLLIVQGLESSWAALSMKRIVSLIGRLLPDRLGYKVVTLQRDLSKLTKIQHDHRWNRLFKLYRLVTLLTQLYKHSSACGLAIDTSQRADVTWWVDCSKISKSDHLKQLQHNNNYGRICFVWEALTRRLRTLCWTHL